MAAKKDDQPARDEEHPESVIRDKRRIDPETGDVRPVAEEPSATAELTEADMELLEEAERDLVAEYRDRAARAEAELQNFRTRVERDRQANRDAVIAEVIRSLLPVMDDLDRADSHGDLAGTPLELVAHKLRAGFERYGVAPVGTVGEAFDPNIHEAVVRLPDPEATSDTVADVIEGGYTLGERLIRPAKVAVSVPTEA
jgi:molecular chaperone GrpE